MPKTYNDVRREYLAFKDMFPDDTRDLTTFAKQQDQLEGKNERAQAYTDGILKQASAAIDRGFEATQLPQGAAWLGRQAGEGFDALVGTSVAPTVESVARELPRGIAESVLTMIPGAGWAGGLARLAGYGSAALSGVAQTDSLLGGAVSAGTLKLGNKLLLPEKMGGMNVGGRAAKSVQSWLDRSAPDLAVESAKDIFAQAPRLSAATAAQSFVPGLAGVATDAATTVGLNEASRQAMLSVGPNRVGLFDEQRNPFTQENIAANVVGALPFTPQAIAAIRNRPHLVPKQLKQLDDWRQLRDATNKEYADRGYGGYETNDWGNEVLDRAQRSFNEVEQAWTPENVVKGWKREPRYNEQQVTLFTTALQEQFTNLENYKARGDIESVEQVKKRIQNIIRDLSGERMTPEQLSDMTKIMDETVRMSPPTDVKGLQKFIQDFNLLAEQWNDMFAKMQEEYAVVRDDPKTKKMAGVGETWHPDARHPSVLDRLMRKGLLEPITEESLKKKWNAEFNEFGDPQFAYEVVLQKELNAQLDRVNMALELEKERGTKAVSQVEELSSEARRRQVAYEEEIRRYAEALEKVPKEHQEGLFRRAVEIASRAPGRITPFSRRQVTQEPSWRRNMIRAMESYDPATDSVLLWVRKEVGGKMKRVLDRVPLRMMYEAADEGGYIWEPSTALLPVEEGGKKMVKTGKGTREPEMNLEEIPREQGAWDTGEALDEQEFRQKLAEEKGLAGSMEQRELTEAEKLGKLKGGEEVVPEQVGTVGFLEQMQKDRGEVFRKAVENLDKIDDDQLESLTRSEFAVKTKGLSRSDPSAESRKVRLRTAIKAVLENWVDTDAPLTQSGKDFIRLSQEQGRTLPKGGEREQFRVLISDLFKNASKVEGGKTGTFRDRVWNVLQLLADDAKVGKVKGMPESRASGGFFPPYDPPVLVNKPPVRDSAGVKTQQFQHDVYRTVRTYYHDFLGKRGLAGSLREMYTEMATALAMQVEGLPVEFYKLQTDPRGPAGLASGFDMKLDKSKNFAALGINFSTPGIASRSMSPDLQAFNLMRVLAHELAHIDQYVVQGYIPHFDTFAERRRTQLDNVLRMADMMTDEERDVMLKTLSEALIPPEYRNGYELKNPEKLYGSHSPEEFHAVLMEIISASLLRGEAKKQFSVNDVFDHAPAEIQQFAQGTFRAIRDVLEPMTEALADPGVIALRKDRSPFVTSEIFNALVRSSIEASRLSEGQKLVQDAKKYMSSLSPGAAIAPPTAATKFYYPKGFTGSLISSPALGGGGQQFDSATITRASQAVSQAGMVLNPQAFNRAANPGVWARWFYPFASLMESMDRAGVPLARPIMKLALELDARATRRRSNLLAPFLTPDKSGAYKFNEEHALLQRLGEKDGKSGMWRRAFNDLSVWQQENGYQSLFIKDQNGQLVINDQVKGAKEMWEKAKGRLSPKDQQVVMAAMESADKIGQLVGVHLLDHITTSSVNRLAALFMAMNKGMTYEQGLEMSKNTLSAWATGGEAGMRQVVQVPKQADQVLGYLGGPDGMFARYKEAEKVLLGRSGFRTESLPGDWIVQFKNQDGKVRYLSADTEAKAKWLENKLVSEGNTIVKPAVDKKSLKNFEDFDAPDTILAKFTEVEGATWAKVLDKVAEKWGQDVVEDLKAYTPGGTSMKEMEVKGIGKFLAERKELVDRSRYDYLDGMINWVGKVASAIEYKETRQMKDLILADPRAKAFPTLREHVDPHFDNMMTPTSQLAREVKTMVSAYFMGGSLASAIMNATQSLTTLVPILIQYSKKGGPIEAWGMMGKAIAKATDLTMSNRWQEVAAQAAKKDPKTWTLEESQAYYYKRNIEEGGINQGVIQDDIFSSTDQRALLAAKFGHGDYGPVDKADLIRNPLYLGAQLSLKPFGWVEHFNNKISLMSGIEQAYKNGLRGEQLYDHAKLVKVLSTFGGGKANAPGLVPKLSTPWTRSAVGVVNTLQQYGYGVVAAYGQFVKDSLSRNPALTPQQRWQARKAFATMFATQVALGGALGLPFAGAALAVLEQVFGVPANQLVREGLASLGRDEEEGAVIAETALNGAANQLFGLDLSSRLGVSNLLGTSSYRGFNLNDLAGPVGGVIGNAVEGLSLFAQGQPEKAAKALVPAAMKNAVELYGSREKYGDMGMRDQQGDLLYNPTTTQAAWYVAGLRPAELSQKRQAQRMMRVADTIEGGQWNREMDRAARGLMAGNTELATELVRDAKSADMTVDPQALYRSIVRRAVDMQSEKDLLATGQRVSEASRQRIAGTFGEGVVTRQSEMQRAQVAAQLGVQFGLKPDLREFRKAALVDMLVQQRGMPRSAALRLAEFVQ